MDTLGICCTYAHSLYVPGWTKTIPEGESISKEPTKSQGGIDNEGYFRKRDHLSCLPLPSLSLSQLSWLQQDAFV